MGGRAESDGSDAGGAVGGGAAALGGRNLVARTRTTDRGSTSSRSSGSGSGSGRALKQNNKAKLPHRMRRNGSYFGHLNARIYLIYLCCYLLLIMAAAGSNNVVNGLKCYCNPKECDVIRALDCPGKGLMLWDPCQ